MKKTLFPVSRCLAFALIFAFCSNTVTAKLVFQDTFERQSGPLNLSLPTGEVQTTTVWTADTIPYLDGDGRLMQFPHTANFSGGWGIIDLGNLLADSRATVKLTVDVRRNTIRGGARGWLGVGFANSGDVTRGSPPFGATDGGPWLRLMDDGNAIFYGGPNISNPHPIRSITPLDHNITLMLTIDRRNQSYHLRASDHTVDFSGNFSSDHNPNFRFLFIRWFSADRDVPSAMQLEGIKIEIRE